MNTFSKFVKKLKAVVTKDEVEDSIGNLRDILQHMIQQTGSRNCFQT